VAALGSVEVLELGFDKDSLVFDFGPDSCKQVSKLGHLRFREVCRRLRILDEVSAVGLVSEDEVDVLAESGIVDESTSLSVLLQQLLDFPLGKVEV